MQQKIKSKQISYSLTPRVFRINFFHLVCEFWNLKFVSIRLCVWFSVRDIIRIQYFQNVMFLFGLPIRFRFFSFFFFYHHCVNMAESRDSIKSGGKKVVDVSN